LRKLFTPLVNSLFIAALLLGSSVRSVAKVMPRGFKEIDVNVVVHGNVGLTAADAEELAEDLLEAAKFHVVDQGDGPDVLEVTVIIEADDNDDDDDGIPDSKDDDDDGDGEPDDKEDDDHNDGKGFHISVEVEGGWHDDDDCDAVGVVDDLLKAIFGHVVDHIHEIEK
jgi:hypothetical protein